MYRRYGCHKRKQITADQTTTAAKKSVADCLSAREFSGKLPISIDYCFF